MIQIENSRLRVSIHPLGAELKSVFHKDYNLEYIWQGNPAFWAKSSPVLFPIVALTVSTLIEGYVWTPLAGIGVVLALLGNVLVLRRPAKA